MKETEYIDATDLAKLVIVLRILTDCACMDDPNNTRLKSVIENVRLMTIDLRRNIDIED